MLTRLEKGVAIGVVVTAGLVVVAGAVVALRWEHVAAWLDAPEVLAAEDAVREAVLPAGFDEDPSGSGCAPWPSSRCAWTDLPPSEAVESLAEVLRREGLELGDVRCDVPEAGPEGMSVGDSQCGAVATVRGADLWLQATDRTPSGGVPFGRTAVWATWDGSAMSMPLWDRLWVHQGGPGSEPVPPTARQVEALLPAWLAAVTTGECVSEDPGACTAWELPLDVTLLPGSGAVEALVRDLGESGFFVSMADPTHAAPIQAHRFATPDAWTGVDVVVRLEDTGPVAMVLTF